MSKTNHERFEALDPKFYAKTPFAASLFFKNIGHLALEVGFDVAKNGFLAIHKRHSADALEQEIPACAMVKNLGRRVILLDENSAAHTPDALIDDAIFEIKRISKAVNLERAVWRQFRTTYKKSNRLLLHVDQDVPVQVLKYALFRAAQRYVGIGIVWVLFQDSLHYFSHDDIIAGRHFDKNTKGESGEDSP